MSQVKTNKD